jgi:hypothetical protein
LGKAVFRDTLRGKRLSGNTVLRRILEKNGGSAE